MLQILWTSSWEEISFISIHVYKIENSISMLSYLRNNSDDKKNQTNTIQCEHWLGKLLKSNLSSYEN